MELSLRQEEALNLLAHWFRNDSRRPFVLNGYAGTGKTTIAKKISEKVGIEHDSVIFVAFTGKAALQLRKKGCDTATTIHKLLYKPIEKSRKELSDMEEMLEVTRVADPEGNLRATRELISMIKNEKRKLAEASFEKMPDEERINRSNLIVVDESSMISGQIAKDLEATGLPVVYCGDPFQLPPVKGISPLTELPTDVMLTEVHRQALENPVLAFATDLRNGKFLGNEEKTIRNGEQELRIIYRETGNYALYDAHDQIICASNKTKFQFNKKIQEKKILEGKVIDESGLGLGVGDRIIFLRNDQDSGICNGSIGYVNKVEPIDQATPTVQYPHRYWNISGTADDDTVFEEYRVDNRMIVDPPKPGEEKPRGQHIDLAYAITCHKSQGSEWDSVFVHFEGLRETNMSRWLYTAATRARLRCTISVPSAQDVR